MAPERIVHQVTAGDAGLTVGALAERLAGATRALAAARGGVWLDGRRVAAPDARLSAGAVLELCLPPEAGYCEVELEPADIAYEDPWLIALHKRAGWYVSATPWDAHGNVLAALTGYLAARDGAAPPLHLAHRLDRDTSGVLLLSKDRAANAALQRAFDARAVHKRYHCLCAGVPDWEEVELRTGHGRSRGGRWRLYPLAAVGEALPAGGGTIREAHSSFHLEHVLRDAALVAVSLHTGRTHQIRLHMAELGLPLLGDLRYGGPPSYAGQPLAGHLLHASELDLAHPISGAPLSLRSPLPASFAAVMDRGRSP